MEKIILTYPSVELVIDARTNSEKPKSIYVHIAFSDHSINRPCLVDDLPSIIHFKKGQLTKFLV